MIWVLLLPISIVRSKSGKKKNWQFGLKVPAQCPPPGGTMKEANKPITTNSYKTHLHG